MFCGCVMGHFFIFRSSHYENIEKYVRVSFEYLLNPNISINQEELESFSKYALLVATMPLKHNTLSVFENV